MKEEKEQVMDLADYIDHLDIQFEKLFEEIKEVKEKLGQMEDRGEREKVSRVMDKVGEEQRRNMTQILGLKERFMKEINHAIICFKEKGATALYQVAKSTGIRDGLLKLKNQINHSIASIDKGIVQLSVIGDELFEMKYHFGNIKRELFGGQVKSNQLHDIEKGTIFQAQKFLFQAQGTLRKMEKRTDRMLGRIEQLAKDGGQVRPSVREQLKELKAEENMKIQSNRGKVKHRER